MNLFFYDKCNENLFVDIPVSEFLELPKKLQNRLYGYRSRVLFNPVNINLKPLDISLTNDNVYNKNISIIIYDSQGRQILSKKLNKLLTDGNEITIKNCSKGVYFIKIKSADQSISFMSRVIKL